MTAPDRGARAYPGGMIREFAAGVGTLLRGFALWRTRPRLLALGLIPAVISFLLLAALLIPLAFSLGAITAWKPYWRIAHGACSREEPQPKFSRASSTVAPW